MLLECCFQQPSWLRHRVGSFSFCRCKKILIYQVAATMCSSARPLRLKMYRCISYEVPTRVVMKLWYIMKKRWWETQMVPTTPPHPPPVRECLRGYFRAYHNIFLLPRKLNDPPPCLSYLGCWKQHSNNIYWHIRDWSEIDQLFLRLHKISSIPGFN